MTFREAAGRDTAAIRSLLESARLPTESLGTGVTTFYVAEQDGAVVGIAGLEFYLPDALLRSVAVPAELRNRGVGSQLVDFVLETAATQDVRRIVLLTETAQKFFARKGFSVIERALLNNPGLTASSEFAHACPKSAACMIYRLAPAGA